MLIPRAGGPAISRMVRYPPLEFEAGGGVYVLVDDGSPESSAYEFVPSSQ